MTSSGLDTLFAHAGHPLVHPSLVQPTPELAGTIPETLARRFDLLPVLVTRSQEKPTLWVAMADPADASALAACAHASGLPTRSMRASLDEVRASFHRWYGGAPPKPAVPPPKRPTSILELDAVSLDDVPSARPRRAPSVLVVQAPESLAALCRTTFASDPVDVRQVDLLDAGSAARATAPFAIVVPDDVYRFDPGAFSSLAIGAGALLITAEEGHASHVEPALRTAHRSMFSAHARAREEESRERRHQ